jgi:hypothetical protein
LHGDLSLWGGAWQPGWSRLAMDGLAHPDGSVAFLSPDAEVHTTGV